MNRILTLLLLAALPLAACSTVDAENGPLSGTARQLGSVDNIEMTDGVIRFDDSDLAVYQVTLINQDNDQAWVEYHAWWFDEGGIEIRNPSAAWIRMNIQPGSHRAVRSVAPSMKAVRCEIQIREPQDSVR
ncbi:MAG: DUF1425 domain-containing protein [Planctomycetes bacterium]|nr:DUF1425 domain-containing protein [Planctomycetota bacterium]NQU48881.1 DUF1425 domain-containing protein [Planctomycetota bacterium]